MNISPSFDFKPLKDSTLPLYQIRLAGDDFRATMLRPQNSQKVYWIDIFKKTKGNNRNEIDAAKERAADFWSTIKED